MGKGGDEGGGVDRYVFTANYFTRNYIHSSSRFRRSTVQMLAQAARELARLPEAAEAARAWAGTGGARALPLLTRAAQVMEAVPMPALKLVAHGALAQALRSEGKVQREAEQWDKASAATRDGPASLHLHAINGAAMCALSRADHEALSRAFQTATARLKGMDDDAELATRWRLAFQVHEGLGGLAGFGAGSSAAALAVRAEAVASEATVALTGGAAAAADTQLAPSLAGLHQASLLLLGDARRAASGPGAGDDAPRPSAPEVAVLWEEVARASATTGDEAQVRHG